MTKHVIVPQEELDKLEQARIELYEILDSYKDEFMTLRFSNVTGTMWAIANRKWPEVKGEAQ